MQQQSGDKNSKIESNFTHSNQRGAVAQSHQHNDKVPTPLKDVRISSSVMNGKCTAYMPSPTSSPQKSFDGTSPTISQSKSIVGANLDSIHRDTDILLDPLCSKAPSTHYTGKSLSAPSNISMKAIPSTSPMPAPPYEWGCWFWRTNNGKCSKRADECLFRHEMTDWAAPERHGAGPRSSLVPSYYGKHDVDKEEISRGRSSRRDYDSYRPCV